MTDPLAELIESEVEKLGFEVVELERAGSRTRPILRLRIDRLNGGTDSTVTVEDCRLASRSLEAMLDDRRELSARYVLEVSSPGVERPLIRPRDFERFAGQEIAIVGRREVVPGSRRVEGELIGLDRTTDPERILVRTASGEEVAVPRDRATRVHLVFRWGGSSRSG